MSEPNPTPACLSHLDQRTKARERRIKLAVEETLYNELRRYMERKDKAASGVSVGALSLELSEVYLAVERVMGGISDA